MIALLLFSVGCERRADPTPVATPNQPLESQASAPRVESGAQSASDPEVSVDEIKQWIDEGEFEKAEQGLRRRLAIDPTDPPLLFLAARCSYERGELSNALEYLSLIPEDHPQAGLAAQGQAADWLMQAGRLPEAEVRFEKMIQRYGNLPPLHRRMASLLNSQGRRVEAAEHVRQLIRLGDVTEKELLSLTTLSVPFHDEQVDLVSGSPLHQLARAKRMLVQDDVPQARQIAERLYADFPESTAIAAFVGRVYNVMQADDLLANWGAALPSGIETEPEYWAALGQWMLRRGEPKVAVRCLSEAVVRDPTDRVAYLRLAEALAAAGDSAAAERVADRQQLLQQCWQWAINIGFGRDSRHEDMQRLAEKLSEVNRPWEAVAWEFIAAHDRNELDQKLPGLREKRAELAERDPGMDDTLFLTCGVDLAEYPRPDLQSLAAELPTTVSTAATASNRFQLDPVSSANASFGTPFTSAASIKLVDVAKERGIDFQYLNNHSDNDAHIVMYQTAGGGIAAFDFDLDGWTDLYFCQAGGLPNVADGSQPNRLYRNLAGQQFVDVAGDARTDDRGYGQGVAAADLNQDGFLDLVVANIGENVIYINNGDGTFTETTIAGSGGWTTSIAVGDLDGDALPEIVEINYIEDPAAFTAECWGQGFDCTPRIFRQANDRVLRRDADGNWQPWESGSRFAETPNYGFAGVIANFDQSAGNDLFIVNDTKENHFWVSRDGDVSSRFGVANQAALRGCASGASGEEQGCMGIAAGDFDRNGLLDLHVTNYWQQPANLYLQRSSGFFTDYAAQYGIAEPSRATVAFGTQASDFDRDGWLDLAVLNGHVFDPVENNTPEVPFRMPPQLFRGARGGFALDAQATEADLFWSTPTLGRTLAKLDFNRDGREDLVANHLDASLALLENQTAGGNWLRLDLVGVTSERDAIGAHVTVRQADDVWHGWVIGGDGYLCTNEPTVDFGVGDYSQVAEVKIQWPSGAQQVFTNVDTNQSYLVVENDDRLVPR
ncbi:ASPIC/UnbV domain protein [Rhodopirellula maiorica SM1]|uniref:ASPIC/UnbV domain protein n=2 Tax=Novipirellula TaxID=2795426 RepID=M5RZQ5_9BACT|nr:ASPIC/UnbV domain protein [Rhodopirellula maiorica SM1]